MSSAPIELRTRFWVEAILASVSAALVVVTTFWHDWLEAFGFDPDHRDGSVEWLVVAGLLAVTLALAAVARLDWRRTVVART
jgi:DMSO/TMAO reductase YedYZ heme-binding membrane subunit